MGKHKKDVGLLIRKIDVPNHKHHLRIMGTSVNQKTILFGCIKCKQVQIYRRVSIQGMLLNVGRKYKKKYRTS